MLHLVYALLCPVFYFTMLASKYVDVGVMLVRLVSSICFSLSLFLPFSYFYRFSCKTLSEKYSRE